MDGDRADLAELVLKNATQIMILSPRLPDRHEVVGSN